MTRQEHFDSIEFISNYQWEIKHEHAELQFHPGGWWPVAESIRYNNHMLSKYCLDAPDWIPTGSVGNPYYRRFRSN